MFKFSGKLISSEIFAIIPPKGQVEYKRRNLFWLYEIAGFAWKKAARHFGYPEEEMKEWQMGSMGFVLSALFCLVDISEMPNVPQRVDRAADVGPGA